MNLRFGIAVGETKEKVDEIHIPFIDYKINTDDEFKYFIGQMVVGVTQLYTAYKNNLLNEEKPDPKLLKLFSNPRFIEFHQWVEENLNKSKDNLLCTGLKIRVGTDYNQVIEDMDAANFVFSHKVKISTDTNLCPGDRVCEVSIDN